MELRTFHTSHPKSPKSRDGLGIRSLQAASQIGSFDYIFFGQFIGWLSDIP